MTNNSQADGKRGSVPGFRFSITDAGAILLFCFATLFAWPYLGTLSLLLPIVLFHFFLFCNVFRAHRNFELIWGAVFLINVMAWTFSGYFNWWWILLTQLPITLGILILTISSPGYHGIFYWIKTKENNQPSS